MGFAASLMLAATIVAHDPGYNTSLANHLGRWLRSENVSAPVVAPTQMASALAHEKIAFLVGFSSPTAAELQTLRNFRSRGGKLVVFHSSSQALGEIMGVKPVGYRAAAYPGEWSCMNFSAKLPEGLPTSVRQTSGVLQRAVAIPGRSRVIATWSDRRGKSVGEPAWIASSSGYWMTHVLTADGDEHFKARLCAALVGSVEPSKWSNAAHIARCAARDRAHEAVARQQVPRSGEIHAVWDHSGCGIYPGDWARTMRALRSANVTDLFVNVAGAGFAHYPSSVLPRSKTFEQEGDQVAACLASARGTGIRVHAWVLCFTGTRAAPDRLEAYRQKGWRLSAKNGKLTEYLNPSLAAVRSHVLSAVDELQTRYPALAGIHLDFVRWGDGTVKPKNAQDYVTAFVSEARRRVKRPRWLTTAVYGGYPGCVASVGQDWDAWLRLNLVDYVVPMDYTESDAELEKLLSQQSLSRSLARRTIVGVGVTANESRLDATQVIRQINAARRHGFAGNALFDLDITLETQILPYLRMGIWGNPK